MASAHVSNNRIRRARMGQETLEILESGSYTIDNGQSILIREEIDKSVRDTVLYTPVSLPLLLSGFESEAKADGGEARPEGADSFTTLFQVIEESTLSACRRLVDEHPGATVACLNFASAKNAGGGFLKGSQAQEESLARSSALYASEQSPQAAPYYQSNRKDPRHGLYTEHLIYSPKVPVFRNDCNGEFLERFYTVDMLTMPACNRSVTKREEKYDAQVSACMRARIGHVLAVARARACDVLVLGAWGCGVFQNEPREIANHFKQWLMGGCFKDNFRVVVFAVMDNSKNKACLEAFREIFR